MNPTTNTTEAPAGLLDLSVRVGMSTDAIRRRLKANEQLRALVRRVGGHFIVAPGDVAKVVELLGGKAVPSA